MLVAYCVMCLIYGTTFLAIKLGMNAGFAPFMFAGLRFVLAGCLLMAYLALTGTRRPADRRDYGRIALVGLCMTTAKFAALYWAQQHLPTGSAALLVATFPIMVTIVSYFADRKKLTPLQLTGLAGGFGGVALLMLPKLTGQLTPYWLYGAAAIMAGEFINACGVIVSRRLLAGGLSPAYLNGLQMLFGSAGLLAVSLLTEPNPFPAGSWTTGTAALLYLAGAGSVVGAGIYYWLIKMINPVIPSTWSYVSPVIALGVGRLVLRESLHPLAAAGSVVILGSVVLTNYEALRGAYAAAKTHTAVE